MVRQNQSIWVLHDSNVFIIVSLVYHYMQITITLPEQVVEKLDEIAESRDTSRSWVVKQMIRSQMMLERYKESKKT